MNTKRNVYLNMKPLEEARQILFDHFPAMGTTAIETVSPPDAVGRVLAEPVVAAVSSPNFHAAAMDGVAVDAVNTYGASQTKPRELTVGAQAHFVNTGHVMPGGTNAVIMIENIQTVGEIVSASKRRPFPGSTFARWAKILWPPNCFIPGATR